MWRLQLTQRSRSARWFGVALFALLLAPLAMPPVAAMQSAPDAATRAAMERRTAARTLLSSALARIASNNSDSSALLDAGRASIALEDYRAALGFLVRAEQAAPRDGAVKAALGSAMVHMENPTRALDYFGEAQLLGAPERMFLSDRGFARDLLGQQDAAQRDYRLALSIAPNDETLRRFALSLGISGETDRAVQLLAPQLRAQDRGAWRLRAMILAINGRQNEASEIVNATMPPALAQNILPYLSQMDRLNPAQQAAAAHFGRFPADQPRAQPPVRVAIVTPPPPAASVERARSATASATPPAVVVRRKPDPPLPAAPPPPTAASPPPASRPVAPPASVPAAPVPIGVVVDRSDGPVGPGFSIADIGTPASASVPPAVSASPVSLADIIGSIEIPPGEMTRSAGAVDAATLARLQADKRRAEAAEAAQREKDAAAAKARAEADAKAKAAAEKKKDHPARAWVQIATGANAKALAFDYGRFARKNAALFKGKAGAIAEWGNSRRLLVGPFKDRKAAQAWLDDYKKAGGDAFLFSSEAGETVDPIR